MITTRYAGALVLLGAGLAFFIARGYQDERIALRSIDFKQPYSSSRCLLEGCDPYSEAQTRAAFLRADGTNDTNVFLPYSALYPPFSLEVLVPIAALPYPRAHQVWEASIALFFSLAVLLTANLCLLAGEANLPIAVLAAFAADSTILLMEGQISGIAISLLLIGFWCLFRDRLRPVAIACLALAVLLKPHIALLPLFYLALAGGRLRKTFVITSLCCGVLALSGILWCSSHAASRHWLAELQSNIAGNESGGNANDPTRGHAGALQTVSLQALVGAIDIAPRAYNTAAAGISLLLLLAWAYPALRMRDSLPKHLLAVATISCLALLPVYHRQYDTRIFLLAFPAAAWLWQEHRKTWGTASLLLLMGATILSAHQTLHRLERAPKVVEAAGPLATLLLYRPLPWTALLLTLFFLAAFYQRMLAETRSALPLNRDDPPEQAGAPSVLPAALPL